MVIFGLHLFSLRKFTPIFVADGFYARSQKILGIYGIWGNLENILRQTLYELVIALFTPSCDTRGFSCNLIGIYSEFKLSTP